MHKDNKKIVIKHKRKQNKEEKKMEKELKQVNEITSKSTK